MLVVYVRRLRRLPYSHTHTLSCATDVLAKTVSREPERERQININSQCAKVPGVNQKAFPPSADRPKRHGRRHRRRLRPSAASRDPSKPPKPTLTRSEDEEDLYERARFGKIPIRTHTRGRCEVEAAATAVATTLEES